MTKQHLKYLRNEVIEDITAQRIREYEAKAGVTILVPASSTATPLSPTVWSEILFTRAINDDQAYRLYKQLTDGQDAPEVRSAVDRYQSALLMPKWLILEAGQRYDFTKWPALYRLAEEAQVSWFSVKWKRRWAG